MSKKLIIGIASVALLFVAALGIGAYMFNNADSSKNLTVEAATIKTVDAKQILKSENIITKLGTSPMDKAFAKAEIVKKQEAKRLAIKKAKAKAAAKRARILQAKAEAKAKAKAQAQEEAKANSEENADDSKETSTSGYKKLGTFSATAYCGCASCCGSAGGHTASGTTPTAGRTIATDPSVIPLGTKVLIDGHEYVAEDTGGAIGGQRVDIFFSSHSEALQFGRRSVEVSIKK